MKMKIQSLHIENFRGIKQLDLDLTAPVTVLVGENGAGKSSVLDCMATLLSWYLARLRSPKGIGSHFGQTDIRLGEDSVRATLKAKKIGDNEAIEWSLTTARTGSGEASRSQLKDLNATVSRWIEQYNEFDRAYPKHGLPLVVHYTVNRAVLDIPLRIRTPVDLESYQIAFAEALGSAVDFRSFFAWFRQREDLEQEGIIHFFRTAESRGISNPEMFPAPYDGQLNAVREAIEQFTGFANLQVRRSPLHMELKKKAQTVWVDHLSDGEKCLLAMIGDLARRLAILSRNGLNDPLQGPGVVLIDEIDLHLHPAWQRELIPKLVKTFPNCQFIVSTHSPQVISDVRPEAVFLLRQTDDNIVVSHPEDSFGQTSDRILEDLMEVPARPVEIKKSLESLFDQISKGDLDAAQKHLAELQEQIGTAPELTSADTFIRRKRVSGE